MMPYMKATIEALKEAGVRDRVRVIVGADGYAPDASRALKLARPLLG